MNTRLPSALARSALVGLSLVATASAAEKVSLAPPVLLPDGQEFKTWEKPSAYTRTYYVVQKHPQASDDNPGTEALPFRTIGRAAAVLQPGERVVVAEGIYRERVRPARGGSGPERMIGYEAAPGANVVLSGSRVLEAKWTKGDSPIVVERKSGQSPVVVWSTTLPKELFDEPSPFAQLNLTDQQIDKCMDWAVGTKGKVPNTFRRGLVFQDGRRLRQVAVRDELAAAAGAYWVADDGATLQARFFDDADPHRAKIEVTTRGMIFAPEEFGLGYIRVKGFIIEHAGNCFPRPQQGALSAQRGHHWIIEDNTVRECNSIGIDIGDQFATGVPKLAEGGQHLVRRNRVSDCGIGGIEGKSIEHTLIEENHIARCGWQRAERIWETGGMKVHCTVSTLVRRNLVEDTIDGPGIWMDYANKNSRCTRNVVVGGRSSNGAIFMEASQAPNLVDHNVVWGNTGSGLYQHDCDELTIANNFVAACSDAGIRMQVIKGRKVGGRLSTAKRNKIVGNVLVDTGQPFAISDPDNACDGNLIGPSRKPFDLAAWQKEHGWDRSSVLADVRATLDRKTLELRWSAAGKSPQNARPAAMTADFWNRPYKGEMIVPGPFGAVPSSPVQLRLGLDAGPPAAKECAP